MEILLWFLLAVVLVRYDSEWRKKRMVKMRVFACSYIDPAALSGRAERGLSASRLKIICKLNHCIVRLKEQIT